MPSFPPPLSPFLSQPHPPIQHSSIVKSIHQLFTPDAAPLTKREVFAAPFHEAVTTLDTPRTDCPMTLPEPLTHRDITPLPPMGSMPPSGLHHDLGAIAAGISGSSSIEEILSFRDEDSLARHTAALVNLAFGKDIVPVPVGDSASQTTALV